MSGKANFLRFEGHGLLTFQLVPALLVNLFHLAKAHGRKLFSEPRGAFLKITEAANKFFAGLMQGFFRVKTKKAHNIDHSEKDIPQFKAGKALKEIVAK